MNKEEIIGKVLKELKKVLECELSDEDVSFVVSFLDKEISKIDDEEKRFEREGSRVVFNNLFNHVEEKSI
jgi:hypothetical protein